MISNYCFEAPACHEPTTQRCMQRQCLGMGHVGCKGLRTNGAPEPHLHASQGSQGPETLPQPREESRFGDANVHGRCFCRYFLFELLKQSPCSSVLRASQMNAQRTTTGSRNFRTKPRSLRFHSLTPVKSVSFYSCDVNLQCTSCSISMPLPPSTHEPAREPVAVLEAP